MEAVELESLAAYPELPVFKSCFSYFGRPILPPIISTARREELTDYRKKAISLEEKLKKVKEEKLNKIKEEKQKSELISIVQNVIDAVIDAENEENNKNDSSTNSMGSDCDYQSISPENLSPIMKASLGSNVHYEEVMDNDEDQNNDVTVVQHHVNNWMSDSDADTAAIENDPSETFRIFKDVDHGQCPYSESDVQSSNRSTDLDRYLDSSIDYERVSSVSSSSGMSPDIPDTVISRVESVDTLDNSSRTITPAKNMSPDENSDTVTPSSNCVINVSHLVSSETKPTDSFSLDENKNTAFNLRNHHHQSWLSKILSKSLRPRDMSKSVSDLADNNSPPPPRLVRSNSYTLDSPSPVLVLSHLGCQCPKCPESSVKPFHDSIYLSNEDHLATEKRRETYVVSKSNDSRNFEIEKDSSLNSVFSEVNSNNSLDVSLQKIPSQVSPASENENVSELSNVAYHTDHTDEQSSETNSEIEVKELYKKFLEMREKTLMDLQMDQLKQFEAVKDKFDIKEKELCQKLSLLSVSTSKVSESVSNLVPSTSSCSTQELIELSPSTPTSANKDNEQLSLTVSSYSEQEVVEQAFSPSRPYNATHTDTFVPVLPYYKDQIPSTPPPSNMSRDKQFSANPLASPISEMRFYIANNNNRILAEEKQKSLEDIINRPEMQKKFEKVTALAKGFLTRRLWKSHRVQSLINGIKMSAQEMVNIKQNIIINGRGDNPSEEDIEKQKEVFNRVTEMDHMLDYIFFGMNVKERMAIIAETRELNERQKDYALPLTFVTQRINVPSPDIVINKHKLSSATLKSLERKKRSSSTPVNDKTLILQASKKPLHERMHHKSRFSSTGAAKQGGVYRKRILSPRSCHISPPKLKSHSSASKRETTKARRVLC